MVQFNGRVHGTPEAPDRFAMAWVRDLMAGTHPTFRPRDFTIVEVGVEWKDDKRSRVSPIKDMIHVCREALTIRKNLKSGVYNRALPTAA